MSDAIEYMGLLGGSPGLGAVANKFLAAVSDRPSPTEGLRNSLKRSTSKATEHETCHGDVDESLAALG
jgi:hypothetical protein